jgi:hypothetical protein
VCSVSNGSRMQLHDLEDALATRHGEPALALRRTAQALANLKCAGARAVIVSTSAGFERFFEGPRPAEEPAD